eukprot:jgi/Psemu1/306221/fgenesh1_kg.241_\
MKFSVHGHCISSSAYIRVYISVRTPPLDDVVENWKVCIPDSGKTIFSIHRLEGMLRVLAQSFAATGLDPPVGQPFVGANDL